LGELKEVKGAMPVPSGMVEVLFRWEETSCIEGEVTLPEKLTGRLIWHGKEVKLTGRHQRIQTGQLIPGK
jgi:hypothetical protein